MPNPAIPWPGRFACRHGSLVFGGREVTHVAREGDSEVSSARKEVGVVNLSCSVERKDRRLPPARSARARCIERGELRA